MAYEGGAMVGNGTGMFGDAADRLMQNDFDVGVLRPWYDPETKQSYYSRTINGKQRTYVSNTPAVLSYDSWKQFDSMIIRAVTEELSAVADVRMAGLEYRLPNGMGHTVLQYQTQGDISAATVSMDPIRRSEADRPETDIGLLPLPIIHKDFDFSAREIAVSRQGNMPLDTSTAELAARKVAEEAEKMLIGTVDPYGYGGGTIYGYINHPSRATNFSLTAPTGSNGGTVVNEVLNLRQLLINDYHKGPFMLYVNMQWAAHLDNEFSTSKGDNTLRQRILAIEGIRGIKTLDFLPTTNYEMVLVEMKSSNVRMVVGMEPMLMQWESQGGLLKHFKVAAMLVPQLRTDTDSNIGVAHGRSATA
jgi:uncharacterized linocin/CFP29 family protein